MHVNHRCPYQFIMPISELTIKRGWAVRTFPIVKLYDKNQVELLILKNSGRARWKIFLLLFYLKCSFLIHSCFYIVMWNVFQGKKKNPRLFEINSTKTFRSIWNLAILYTKYLVCCAVPLCRDFSITLYKVFLRFLWP